MKKKWNKKHIKELISHLAISEGYRLTEITQKIDHAFPATDLSRWMDTINSHPGGWYHRVKHGHDFVSNVGDVYSRFGTKGVLKYPVELLKDATTPHGIPLPGTQHLVKSGVVSAKTATEWMSMNVADVFSGGVAFYSTYKLWKQSSDGRIDDSKVIWAAIGAGIKITAGVATTNPVLILSGATDSVILISNFEEAKSAFKKFLNVALSDEALAIYSGVASGGVAALGVTGLVSTLGTASTGTAISTLSGAAATKATLAALGGGSLATGGFGIVGGVVALTGGSAIIALASGYGIYHLINSRNSEPSAEGC